MIIYGSREPTGTGPNDNKTNFIKRAKTINRLKPEGEGGTTGRPDYRPIHHIEYLPLIYVCLYIK